MLDKMEEVCGIDCAMLEKKGYDWDDVLDGLEDWEMVGGIDGSTLEK